MATRLKSSTSVSSQTSTTSVQSLSPNNPRPPHNPKNQGPHTSTPVKKTLKKSRNTCLPKGNTQTTQSKGDNPQSKLNSTTIVSPQPTPNPALPSSPHRRERMAQEMETDPEELHLLGLAGHSGDPENPLPAREEQGRRSYQRPSSRVTTPNIHYSILLADSDDPLGPSREEAPLPRNDLQKVKRAISEETTHLEESLITMTKADYHRNNMKLALSSGKFPKGLQPNIPLAAFKPNAALQTKWDGILTDCTKNLLGCLIEHYEDLVRTEMMTQDTQTKTQLSINKANLSDSDQELIGRFWR